MTKGFKKGLRAIIKGKSIKAKMAQAFLAFGLAIVLLFMASAWYFHQENRLNKVRVKLSTIENNLLRAERLERDFLIYETRNLSFFTEGQSEFLNQRKKAFARIKKDLETFENIDEIKNEAVLKNTKDIFNKLLALEQSFDRLVSLIRKRGFKDSGLEGKMRQLIHEVERNAPQLDLGKILTVRRYEKDFIIRKDTLYLQKTRLALQDLKENANQSLSSKEDIANLNKQLQLYQNTLEELVNTEIQIGLEPTQGLRGSIAQLSKSLDQSIEILSQIINTNTSSFQTKLQFVFYTLLLSALILVISMGTYIAKKLGDPITEVSEAIYQIIEQDFEAGVQIPQTNTHNEIGRLAKDIRVMYERILDHNLKIQKQSEEITQQRDELIQKNYEIIEAKEEVNLINEQLLKLKDELEKRVEDRTQQLKITNEELDFFLYRASHDLKGPVASLQGLLMLTSIDRDTAKSELFLTQIDQNVKQLNRLLDKFLMIFEVHHENLLIKPVSLYEIWQKSYNRLIEWHTFSANLIQIDFEGREFVNTDPQLLECILLNLTENALLFGKNYPCNIKITARSQELILYFKDHGEGIAAEFLPKKIFEMFFRGSEKSIGNGLGLYITQKAVEKLGGTISVESTPHRQSIFTVIIPLEIPMPTSSITV